MLMLSMLGILSTYKDRMEILMESSNGARCIINGNCNMKQDGLWKSGKNGSFEIVPTSYKSWSTCKLRITWEEKYNISENKSIIYITNFELWSDADADSVYVGGGQAETRGLYVNNTLVQQMSYFTGDTSFPNFFGGRWVSLNKIPSSFPWTSDELIHNDDGTLIVPIKFDGLVTPSSNSYYAHFNNVVTNITLTDIVS